MERYTIQERAGKGTYGVVHKARDKKTGELVALKTIALDNEEGIPSTAIREISMLKFIRHPNVVTLSNVIHMLDKQVMVFEYLESDLKKCLEVCGPAGLDLLTVKSLQYQLQQGTAFCHKQKVLHRDIKPANLLLNRAGLLKLADFGLSRSFSMDVSVLKHEVVTLWYRGPELLLGATEYGTEIDMWSIGCVFAEMINGTPLFPGTREDIQLCVIFSTLGVPTVDDWPEMTSLPNYEKYRTMIEEVRNTTTPKSFKQTVPKLKSEPHSYGYDQLTKLISINPSKRIT